MTGSVVDTKATAMAHPNIALVKYWGKRDAERILPYQSSISLTISPLAVRTTVEFGRATDEIVINQREALAAEQQRIRQIIQRVQAETPRDLGAVRIHSCGNFPVGTGLASSAAAFAALAVAMRAAAGLPVDSAAASRLARYGSGSACRSIQGGFCTWARGHLQSGEDSFAEQSFNETYWPELRLVAAIVSTREKAIPSRDGMHTTVTTSPYYQAWVNDAESEVGRALDFIRDRDLNGLGPLCERNAWRMHATALAADPPICYLLPTTLHLIQKVAEYRAQGLPAWFTLDAGPNPVFLIETSHELELVSMLRAHGALDVITCTPGGDTRLMTEHLC